MARHNTKSRSSRTLNASSIISIPTLSFLLLGLPCLTSAFDCKEILASKTKFNFKELGGPHVVHWEEEMDLEHEVQYKYNFTLDICQPLKFHKGGCRQGTRICAMREEHDLAGDRNVTIQPIEIAGTYTTDSGRSIDARFELLRDSKSNSDAEREGVRAELHGGRFPWDNKKSGLDQQAIVEFVCDHDRTGLEGIENDKQPDDDKDDKEKDSKDDKKDDKKDEKKGDEKSERLRGRADEDKGGDKSGEDKKSLRFVSYKVDDSKTKVKTLRLEWRTKYACQDVPTDTVSSHWGFFTWFIIILFMLIATYLIFGSWLNYNRFGARGWDLLPHGDTIRDIPYIFRDCARRVKDTVQGSGTRGGYAAV